MFALRVARTVEHLSPSAKACNDITERFLAGDATGEELRSAAAYAAYAAGTAAAADAAYAAGTATAAYTAAYAAGTATAADAAGAKDLVAWLSSIIDIYDELSGRTEHRDISGAELADLALAVRR